MREGILGSLAITSNCLDETLPLAPGKDVDWPLLSLIFAVLKSLLENHEKSLKQIK